MKLNKEIIKYMKDISKLYEVELILTKGKGGRFSWTKIKVGVDDSNFNHIVSVFCHELSHFILWKKGKYKKYHDPKNFFRFTDQFKSLEQAVEYALKAEVATEKLGKLVCKEWFNGIKYKSFYKNDNISRAFLRGFYFRG